MRQSKILIPTLKENPADADVVSHRLMLRAGLIRQLASGLYTWLPAGLRVIRKIEQIVREELEASGVQEVLMPVVQPAELWEETGRWAKMGSELCRLKDRHDRDFCLGPTHEEVITDLFRRELHSYKSLPVNFYQIQTKFRDEVRPRFGVMRAREFTMKDAYSFHLDQTSFDETYQEMYDCYSRILTRMGLDFRAVQADSGNIGGDNSHEFHVLAQSGEDTIVFASDGTYAANLEKATAAAAQPLAPPSHEMLRVDTPNVRTIEQLTKFLDEDPSRCLKTLLVAGEEGPVALVLRGNDELNEVKAEKLSGVITPLQMASEADVVKAVGCAPGSIGPKDLPIPTYVDSYAAAVADFVCGANKDDVHITGVNWQRDVPLADEAIVDLRTVKEGDPAPDNQGTLRFLRGIEVGHIFQLDRVYSEPMKATVLDPDGRAVVPIMGCYGMGITRLAAAIIEQNHDDDGICWPAALAPFDVHIVGINYVRSDLVREAADNLYDELTALGYSVLLDDRAERPGVKFNDADLLGLPHRFTLGDRGLKEGTVEYRTRSASEHSDVALSEAARCVQS